MNNILTLVGDTLWIVGSLLFWGYFFIKSDNKKGVFAVIGIISGVIGYLLSVIVRICWWHNIPGGYASKWISSWMDGLTIALILLMILAMALDEKVQARSFHFKKIYDTVTGFMIFMPFIAFLVGIAFRTVILHIPFLVSL